MHPRVRGTRILADTILSYLRADCPAEAIFRYYPSMPVDGIEAVVRWAETTCGPRVEIGSGASTTALMDRFLIDECLNGELVATTKARGHDAVCVPI